MDILFPPVLESQGLGFEFVSQNAAARYYEIRFQLPLGTSRDAIRHIQVSLKELNTGISAVSELLSPDKAVLYISADSMYFEEEEDGNYLLKLPYRAFINNAPAMNTSYNIQVRFGSTDLWDGAGTGLEGTGFANFAAWRIACTTSVPTTFGEWSNLMKAYCYGPVEHTPFYSFDDFMPIVGWKYQPTGDDPLEQVKITYWFSTVHGLEMRNEVFSGQLQDDNTYLVRTTLPVAPVQNIQVAFEGVTRNNCRWHDELFIPSLLTSKAYIMNYEQDSKMQDMVMSAPELEDGALGKQFRALNNMHDCRYFNVYRIETLTTKCIKIIEKQGVVANEEVSFKDYTCEMGEEYQYVAIATDDRGVCKFYLTPLSPFGEENPGYARLMKMDSTYIVSRAHQLRLQGNVSLSGFKRNTQDNFQTTIGSKYPFYSRASQMNYRSFSLNGVVSINFDPTSSFFRLDAIGKITLGQELTYNQYQVLIAKSPGLETFFNPSWDTKGNPVYRFVGSKDPTIMSVEESIALTNRCASTLALNGLWWDDDNGNGSQLYILDKDIVTTEELSLSRERHNQWGNSNGIETRNIRGALTKYDKYLHRQTGLNYGTDKTDSMVYIERKFREKVMEWLSDGKPKLFRSETEGNMIVMLSGISFSPLDKTGRMVYSVAMTVTEIADMTSENLKAFNLVPTLIKSVYIDDKVYEYTWGQYDQAVNEHLTYQYYSAFAIPARELNNEDGYLTIETISGVYHGSDNLIFSAQNLPQGFSIQARDRYEDGKLVMRAGTVYGYPTGNKEYEPGFAILTVKDLDNGSSASMTIPYGWMYKGLTRKGGDILITSKTPGKDTIDIGEAIKEINLNEFFEGGVAPYSFSPGEKRLPNGVTLDGTKGILAGSYGSALDDGTATVIVKDSLSNTLELEIKYVPGKIPLTFVKKSGWDFGYTEVGVAIEQPWKNLAEGVTGGVLAKGSFYKFSLGDDAPTGWKIGNDDDDPEGPQGEPKDTAGVIWGMPHGTMPPGKFTVYVRDDAGNERSITINYNRILETFTFAERLPDYPIQGIWIPPYETGPIPAEPKDMTIGTIVPGVDVKPYVSGGLPFTSGSQYKFTAIGLLPDWEISRDGILSGKARVGMGEKTATLIATDARGRQATCEIKVGKVEAGIEFRPIGYKISNLYVDKEIRPEDVEAVWGGDGGQFVYKNHFIPLDAIANGKTPYKITMPTGLPGISLTQDGNVWKFTGAPLQAGSARTGWLLVQDSNDLSIRAQINFGAVTEKFQWKEQNKPVISVSGAPEQKISLPLNAIGGIGRFEFIKNGSAAQYLTINSTNEEDITTYTLEFALPNQNKYSGDVQLVITDGRGVTINRSYQLRTSTTKIELKKKKDFALDTVMANHAEFKDVPIIKISGGLGAGNYKFLLKDAADNEVLSTTWTPDSALGLTLKILPGTDEVVVSGTPTKTISRHVSLFSGLTISDGETSTPFTDSLLGPIVVLPPEFGPKVLETPDHTIREQGLLYQASYVGPKLFLNLGFPGLNIDQVGRLPTGILADYNGIEYYWAQGVAASITPEDITTIFDLSTPKTTYDEAIIMRVTMVFGAIQPPFTFYIPSTLKIPALGVETPMEKFLVSEGLSGGSGPFRWSLEGQPDGLDIETDPTDSRKAYIVGTPTTKSSSGRFTVNVVDTSNNLDGGDTIYFEGIFDKMKLEKPKVEIPQMQGGKDLTAIDLNSYVSGGRDPYEFQDMSDLLGVRGYVINQGNLTGTASNFGFDKASGKLKVIDSTGQTIELPYDVGAITGELYYNEMAPGVKATIPGGTGGTKVAAANLFDISKGISGGSGTYTFKENSNYGWSQYGFQIKMDNTGKATEIILPDDEVPAGTFQIDISDGNATVTATISFGAVTIPLRFDSTVFGVSAEIKAGTHGQQIPQENLPVINLGVKGGVKDYLYQITGNLNGYSLSINKLTGVFEGGTYPSTATPSGAPTAPITVQVTDKAGTSINISIKTNPVA